jgi:hypothetical protein
MEIKIQTGEELNRLLDALLTETTADDHKFDDWLCRFTDSEQKAIFGANNIHCYRKGDLTRQGLIQDLERLATPTTDKPKSGRKHLTPENALCSYGSSLWRGTEIQN